MSVETGCEKKSDKKRRKQERKEKLININHASWIEDIHRKLDKAQKYAALRWQILPLV